MFWMHNVDGLGWGWMAFGWIWMVVFWGVVVGFVVWTIKRLSEPQTTTSGTTPIGILKARHARGEITREQFEVIKRDLAAD